MKIIKIYNLDYSNQLTTLTEKDFNELNFGKRLGEIGDCMFLVNLNKDKITQETIKLYNRIEVIGENGVEFNGIITKINSELEVANVRCRELIYILKKKLTPDNYTLADTVENSLSKLLTDLNNLEDTGMTVGDLSGAVGEVDNNYNHRTAFQVLKEITRGTGNQFRLDNNRALQVASEVGEDKSEEVILRYEKNIPQAATITEFNVEENGEEIVSKAYGEADPLVKTSEDASLIAEYGTLESYTNFRVIKKQSILDDFTDKELQDKRYSPRLTISPDYKKQFEVGDVIKLILKNDLIDINDTFQVTEKMVNYKGGGQETIRIRVNDIPDYLAEKLAERERRLQLLEEEL